MNKFKKLNQLAQHLLETTGRKLVAAKVFANCLLLYFKAGSCRFYSKEGFNWGRVGSVLFTTVEFSRKAISKTLWSRHESLIKWYEEYIHASNFVHKLGLVLEYNIKY